MNKIILFSGLLALILNACGNASEKKEIGDTSSGLLQPEQKQKQEKSQDPNSIRVLLQGKWQHTEDKSNYLIFEGNQRKETAGGDNQWDSETFILSDRCSNSSDKESGIEPEQDKYISCEQSDLCWYIISVDKNNLSLSYMGRGNTLNYRRVL